MPQKGSTTDLPVGGTSPAGPANGPVWVGVVGRTQASQIKAYKDDMYLVVWDMSGVRNGPSDNSIKDELLLCKGREIVWKKEFPVDAVLKVWGDKILAVNYSKDGVKIAEIPH
jgi:hypothetical protein